MAVMSRQEWRRRKRRQRMIRKYAILGGLALIAILVLLLIIKLISLIFNRPDDGIIEKIGDIKVQQELLSISDYSRPGVKMESIENIVIHYASVPGTTAADKRDFYESLKDKKESTESVHFIVDLDGTIVQCIPVTETACASKAYNVKCISIEYCNTGADGSMSNKTYENMVALVAYLCEEYEIPVSKVLRHSDITGSMCPLFFVQNEDAWEQFKDDVEKVMKGDSVSVTSGVIDTQTISPSTEPTGTSTPGADNVTSEGTGEPTEE